MDQDPDSNGNSEEQLEEIPTRISDLLVSDFVEEGMENIKREDLKTLSPSIIKSLGSKVSDLQAVVNIIERYISRIQESRSIIDEGVEKTKELSSLTDDFSIWISTLSIKIHGEPTTIKDEEIEQVKTQLNRFGIVVDSINVILNKFSALLLGFDKEDIEDKVEDLIVSYRNVFYPYDIFFRNSSIIHH